jgi:hypothetical protein
LDFSEQIKLKMSYVITVYDVFSVSLPTDAGLIFKKRHPLPLLDSGQDCSVEWPDLSLAMQSSHSWLWHWEPKNWVQGQASFNF